MDIKSYCIAIVLAPLIGSLVAGLAGKTLGRTVSHVATIAGVAVSFALSAVLWSGFLSGDQQAQTHVWYEWAALGDLSLHVGFMVDSLSTLMMVVVTSVSLMVHIYTIGYMHDDDGYQRFFAYISLFTFSMLMLVLADNFLQLFFGWEAVGLVSYLLIGFWFKKESAIFANMKAFLVNRVGDFGFLLGIGAVYWVFDTFDYLVLFDRLDAVPAELSIELLPGWEVTALTVIGIGLFVGAMGKSAQVPLHVWLPDSMEGPTPISALIHAATMVTAGIFMVARLSPLYELSATSLSFILVIGALTAFFMGLIGLVQHDIKRVVAYSTLSQLGYMVVALGVSAYSAGVFHLMTHAFFKALLFLAAGSVIIGMHHEQDMRKMGGLWKKMKLTYATALIGTLALVGFPGTAGYFSKDAIIEAVHHSSAVNANWVYYLMVAGVLITSLYSFRLLFYVFHGKPRMSDEAYAHVHESPMVVWVPLLALAIPSLIIAWPFTHPMLFGSYFAGAIAQPESGPLAEMATHAGSAWEFFVHGLLSVPVLLTLIGAVLAWVGYVVRPELPQKMATLFGFIYVPLTRKYYFDELYQLVFAKGALLKGRIFSDYGDRWVIDGVMVNGSARFFGQLSERLRWAQSGYIYHYAFSMMVGLLGCVIWLLFFS
jgi:NADH-quinone oxidoreductase subunit L